MTSHETIKKFLEKARGFLDSARYNYSKERFDLVAFCIEQSIQLFVKTKVLESIGEFPRTRDVIFLLGELHATFKTTTIKNFIKENITILTKLNDAFITSHCYTREFRKDEIDQMLSFAKKLIRLLEHDTKILQGN